MEQNGCSRECSRVLPVCTGSNLQGKRGEGERKRGRVRERVSVRERERDGWRRVKSERERKRWMEEGKEKCALCERSRR